MSINSYENGTAPDTTVIVGSLIVQSEPGQGSLSSVSFDGGAFTTDGAGNVSHMGNMSPNSIIGAQSATAFVPASGGGAGGTIPTVAANGTGLTETRIAPAGAVTGAILQAGTKGGQIIVVTNESAAASTVTFAAVATSNVAGGVTDSIAGLHAHMFIWDSLSTPAAWFMVGPVAN